MKTENKQSIKSTIVLSAAVILLALFTLVFSAFAWFSASTEFNATQHIVIGRVDIDLSDSGSQSVSSDIINITDAYPTTFTAAAAAYASGALNSYTFTVRNTGTIRAAYRIDAQIAADTNYGATAPRLPLSSQLCYAVRVLDDTTTADTPWSGDFTDDNRLFDDNGTLTSSAKTPIRQYFVDSLLYSADLGGETVYYPVTEKTLSADASSPSNSTTYQILIWLSENATLDTTGAQTETTAPEGFVKPSVSFYFNVHAIQAVGGAHFTESEIAATATETVPDGKTDATP